MRLALALLVIVVEIGCHPDRSRQVIGEGPKNNTCVSICARPECIDSGLVSKIPQRDSVPTLRLDRSQMPAGYDGPWPWSPNGEIEIPDSLANEFAIVIVDKAGHARVSIGQTCSTTGPVHLYPYLFSRGLPSGIYWSYVFHNGHLVGKQELALFK
jgi:hypothetical protein